MARGQLHAVGDQLQPGEATRPWSRVLRATTAASLFASGGHYALSPRLTGAGDEINRSAAARRPRCPPCSPPPPSRRRRPQRGDFGRVVPSDMPTVAPLLERKAARNAPAVALRWAGHSLACGVGSGNCNWDATGRPRRFAHVLAHVVVHVVSRNTRRRNRAAVGPGRD